MAGLESWDFFVSRYRVKVCDDIVIRGAPDPDPDPAGYPVNFVDPVWIRIRPDPECLDPAGIRIRPDPKSPDPAGSYLNTTNTE